MATGFDHKFNTDDVLIRSVIVSLINSLNEKITIVNTRGDNTFQTVPVPFFYAFSGDERFIQDYFTNWSDCVPTWIEGNYDPIPRGSLTLTGVNILNAQQTSRFVRGFYIKEENGELLRYNSYLNSIPMSLTFDVKMLIDTTIDAFKITQQVIKIFYKTLVFRVNFSGVVVPSQAGFSENYNIEKQFEYTYGELNRVGLSFTLEVETYFPIFDEKQEMFAGNNIQKFSASVHPMAMGASSGLYTETPPIDGTVQINHQIGEKFKRPATPQPVPGWIPTND